MRKKYFNQMEDMKGKIRVYARVRPMLGFEAERGQKVRGPFYTTPPNLSLCCHMTARCASERRCLQGWLFIEQAMQGMKNTLASPSASNHCPCTGVTVSDETVRRGQS